jgi:xylan 1,4-beta-xylosidase
LQKVIWTEDGWLRLAGGGWHPAIEVPAPQEVEAAPWPPAPARDGFDNPTLDVNWSSLRGPAEECWLSLRERPGWLRLRGRDSQHSLFDQSLIARRLQAFRVTCETCLEFTPVHFTQMAGLICWYDIRTHFYLRVTYDEGAGKVLGVVLTDDAVYDEPAESQIQIAHWPRVFLRAEIDRERLQFSGSPDGIAWQAVGPVLDASRLSDDYGNYLHFTGAMAGLCAQDVGGTKAVADFDYFEMRT